MSSKKVFNDSVHGSIELDPLLVKIIDTPTFQRLRNIKQLGLAYLVYPGASHNRFEHSIGTAYLAGKLVRMLQDKDKDKQEEIDIEDPDIHTELNIEDIDILCVEIAGLCHDLGHGPFSHVFDARFLPMLGNNDWKHEKGSCDMFEYMLDHDGIREALMEKLEETDFTFIKEMINGPLGEASQDWPYMGRPKSKGFLYEIISNERNKVDVDKWDYFARDCHHLGIHNTFQTTRFMQCLKVLEDEDGNLTICARQKECMNLFEMFHTRSVLHRKAYMHRVVKLIEEMASEALVKANDVIQIPGEGGRHYKMSETIDHPDAYVNLNDDVWGQILRSSDEKLTNSKEILMRIIRRDLYHEVHRWEHLSKGKAENVVASFKEKYPSGEDFIYVKTSIDFGMKNENPVGKYRFYKKGEPGKCFRIKESDVSTMLPQKYEEFNVIVYCKDREKINSGKKMFGNIGAKRRKTQA